MSKHGIYTGYVDKPDAYSESKGLFINERYLIKSGSCKGEIMFLKGYGYRHSRGARSTYKYYFVDDLNKETGIKTTTLTSLDEFERFINSSDYIRN